MSHNNSINNIHLSLQYTSIKPITPTKHHPINTNKTINSENQKITLLQKQTKMSLKTYLLLLFVSIVKISESASAPPLTQAIDPHYFGSHYIKLISATLGNISVFNYGPNVYEVSLGKFYANIKQSQILVSSYKCESMYYFGFKLNVSYSVDPTTKVNITFEQYANSQFSIIGVSVIMITSPFDQVMKLIEFDMTVANQNYSINHPLPVSYYQRTYLKSVKAKSINGNGDLRVLLYNSFIYPDIIRMSFYVYPSQSIGGYDFNVQAFIIILDLTIRPTIIQFSHLTYNWYAVWSNPFSTTNIAINTAKYGKDFNKKCIIGKKQIDCSNYNKPTSMFDLDPNVGFINGVQNNVYNWDEIQSFCFQDLECPSTHPYKMINDSTNCWDCPDGVALSINSIANCLLYDLAFQKISYDPTGLILSYCSKCIDCQNHYFAENASCHLCNIKFPNCLTCNETIQCLSCLNTTAFNTTNNCILCSFFIADCLQCFDNTTCMTCMDGFYLDNNVCFKCVDKIQGCLKCKSATNCTDCVSPLVPKTSNNISTCECTSGWRVTSTCTNIYGCISSHTVNSKTLCYACDSSNQFVYESSHSCSCRRGYIFNNQTNNCDLICGDGLYVKQQCDDGNKLNGDGCTQNCKVQDNFICQNIRYTKSICKLNIPINSSVFSLSRKYGSSSMVLKIQFEPYDEHLQTNNWPSNILVNSSKISFMYHEFENHLLVLHYNLLESIEWESFNWTLLFDGDKFVTGKNELKILMRGMNAPLTLEAFYKHQFALYISSYVLGGVVFVISVVAMIKAESNIAFQLTATALFMFYSRIMTFHSNPAILYTLGGLRVAEGFNEFFPQEHRDYQEFVAKNRFFLMSELGLMIIFTLLVICLLLVIKLVLQAKSILDVINSDKLQITEKVDDQKKEWIAIKVFNQAFMRYDSLQKKFTVPITLMSFFTVFIAYNSFQNSEERYKTHFPEIVTNFILLLFFIIILYYLTFAASILGNLFEKMKVEKPRKRKADKMIKLTFQQSINPYTDLFFVYLFVTSLLFFFTMDFTTEEQNFQYLIETCFGVVLTYTVIILFFKPYPDRLNQGSIIICEIVKMLFLVFLFLIQKSMLSQLLQLIGVYISQFIILLLCVLSVIRIKRTWIVPKTKEEELKEILLKKKQQLNNTTDLPDQIQNKKRKKYVKNDETNPYRYQNILKKEMEQLEKDGQIIGNFYQKIQNKQKTSPSKSYHPNNTSKITNDQTKSNIIFDQTAQKKDSNDMIQNSLINEEEKMHKEAEIERKRKAEQLRKIKQDMRKKCIISSQQKQKKQQVSDYRARTGMSAYEEELQKKYEYHKWRENNLQQAIREEDEQMRKKWQRKQKKENEARKMYKY